MKLSYAETRHAATASLRAGVTPLVWGPPGIGKSAMVALIASDLGLKPAVFVGGTACDDDGAGTPFVHDGQLRHAHRGPLREAIEGPVLLALDEYTTTPEQVQAALLAVILDGRVGDTPLHPGTRVMALANQPEHAPAAQRLSPATANRFVHLTLEPKPKEVLDWFTRCEHPVLSEFGLVAAFQSDLLAMEPPEKAMEQGVSWGSPRAWERGLRAYAWTNPGWADDPKADRVGYAVLAGAVGEAAAASYLQLRSNRKLLPPLAEFMADPYKAMKKVAKAAESQIAVLSILPTVAREDTGAAWCAASKLGTRYRSAAGAALLNRPYVAGPWAEAGEGAQLETLGDGGAE